MIVDIAIEAQNQHECINLLNPVVIHIYLYIHIYYMDVCGLHVYTHIKNQTKLNTCIIVIDTIVIVISLQCNRIKLSLLSTTINVNFVTTMNRNKCR